MCRLAFGMTLVPDVFVPDEFLQKNSSWLSFDARDFSSEARALLIEVLPYRESLIL